MPAEHLLRPAIAADRPAVLDLLAAEGLPVEGVHPTLAGFVVAEEASRVVGVAGLERYGEYGLLRSVAVARGRRGLGLGARLTGAIVDAARDAGVVGVYALTTTAADYFPRLGFEVIERREIPEVVRASPEFSILCPASAVALELRLDGTPDA